MMTPEQCAVGVTVKYRPSMNSSISFVGVIDSTPWQIGNTWVVHLSGMEPAYGIWRCNRDPRTTQITTVKAAALFALEPAGRTTQEENRPVDK